MRYLVKPWKAWCNYRKYTRIFDCERSWKYPVNQNHSSNTISQPMFDYNLDFLSAVPKLEHIQNTPEEYQHLRRFYVDDKGEQRQGLHDLGYKTPNHYEPYENKHVLRPFRHRSGIDFNVIEGFPEVIPEGYYISPLFNKTHEYRILTIKGNPLITLLKRHEGIPVDQPWTSANGSSFVTVHNPENNRLRHTDLYDKLRNDRILGLAHILGIDVMWNNDTREYAISEVNFAPSLTIQENINTIQQHIGVNQ